MTLRPRRTPLVAGLVTPLLAGLLAGCSGGSRPDTAAVVGERAISTADVRTATDQIREHIQPQASETAVLGLLIADELMGDRPGGWVPDAAFNAAVDRVPNATPATIAVLRASTVLSGQPQARELLLAAARRKSVDVNPRYGSFAVGESTLLSQPEREWIRPAGAGADTVSR